MSLQFLQHTFYTNVGQELLLLNICEIQRYTVFFSKQGLMRQWVYMVACDMNFQQTGQPRWKFKLIWRNTIVLLERKEEKERERECKKWRKERRKEGRKAQHTDTNMTLDLTIFFQIKNVVDFYDCKRKYEYC
jgi:hypothetical protein